MTPGARRALDTALTIVLAAAQVVPAPTAAAALTRLSPPTPDTTGGAGVSPYGARPDEQYVTDVVFDTLGRVVRTTDPIGRTSRRFWDSRSNLIATTDAKSSRLIPDPLALRGAGPASTINDHGNVVRRFYDGVSRRVRVERLLKTGGQGDGDPNLTYETNLDRTNAAIPTGIVTTQTVFDRNGRVIGKLDANQNRTAYHWDALDRNDLETMADGSVEHTVFDLDDDVVQKTDPNGSVTQLDHDGKGRVTRTRVTTRARNLAGTGTDVVGTTLQAFEYDGLSRRNPGR